MIDAILSKIFSLFFCFIVNDLFIFPNYQDYYAVLYNLRIVIILF